MRARYKLSVSIFSREIISDIERRGENRRYQVKRHMKEKISPNMTSHSRISTHIRRLFSNFDFQLRPTHLILFHFPCSMRCMNDEKSLFIKLNIDVNDHMRHLCPLKS